ncbi:MAG: anaerobic ribonucleoside-triphosphate reductase activating protein [Candidatus Thorarchaeota archaeon]
MREPKLRIGTIIDVSLSDVPGLPVTMIFTGGCNFNCPYCHNSSLIPLDSGQEMSVSSIVQRVKDFMSDGFCISGGEPTIHPELPALLAALREETGKHINLNTQGSVPSVLRESLPFLDSVWFDIKASPSRYPYVIGLNRNPWPQVMESIRVVMDSDVQFWPRTTYVPGLMAPADIEAILTVLSDVGYSGEYVIQRYAPLNGVRRDQAAGLRVPSAEEIREVVSRPPAGIRIRLDWR